MMDVNGGGRALGKTNAMLQSEEQKELLNHECQYKVK